MYCEFILSVFPQRAILIKFSTPTIKCLDYECVELSLDYECVELCLYVL